jgi:general secretion pathway protein C
MERSILCLVLLAGCGGASEPPPERPASAAAEPAAEPEPPPIETSGVIHRSELDPVLAAGLGRFLGGVGTEPHVEEGRFVGFRLTRLYPDDDRFEDIDLRPGDTVMRVNGQPIERPEQALQVWESLRVASELMIEYLRDGERREIRFAIVD